MSNPIYISQLAFTTGEVSPDVSSRFDLEQYKSALLEAENVVIRPMEPLPNVKAANM